MNLPPQSSTSTPCIQVSADVIRVTRDGRRTSYFTTNATENRLSVEKLNREYNLAARNAQNRVLRQTQQENALELSGSKTDLKAMMEKLEAVEVDIEKNNGLITLSEKAAYIEAIMEKLKADQTDTEKKNALLGLSERAADIIARMQKLETAHVDTENTLRRMLAKLGAPCPI
ncbi:hypothetical protein X797_011754 [Metarhizium robertsii]|uniref:Uncharacterized protein n=2 Tax=Metarhizium robertsii TaxID=568076 RepID=A0A014MVK6_9HYPO|nr:hypothetical protein X797_011754 [Metarhizium robertsii]